MRCGKLLQLGKKFSNHRNGGYKTTGNSPGAKLRQEHKKHSFSMRCLIFLFPLLLNKLD